MQNLMSGMLIGLVAAALIGLVGEDYVQMGLGTPRVLRVDAALFSRTNTWQALGWAEELPLLAAVAADARDPEDPVDARLLQHDAATGETVQRIQFFGFAVHFHAQPARGLVHEVDTAPDLAAGRLDQDRDLARGVRRPLRQRPHLGRDDLARRFAPDFPASLDGAPVLLPVTGSAQRRGLDSWFDEIGVTPEIVAEFDDSALLKAFGEAGAGIFPAPMAIARINITAK